ncbi:transporter substrate-binding domain-containing protein [Bradyrhizobium sp. 153]|uniref:transporter substrate-binding domain-containing protein n=1 Tax=Bradyrhizobium sp. 153 TaxID=2782627 RepID=UPI001FF9F324|nr:transporter substrate-binding domain-containing protein [Bradyrhizobium sp. 153]MCK1663523.1 transporter substrate-binding domain-containing protein [Bradyrhizobium sp. 153]
MCRMKFSWLILLLALPGFSPSAHAGADDALLTSIRKTGEVKVAMGSAPPWMFVSPTGEPKGITVDLMNKVLKGMGLPTLTPVLTAWDAMIPALQARQVDFVAPGLNVTEERCKVLVYSAPTFIMHDALYVLPDNPRQLASYADVARNPDVKLAVVTASTQQAYALSHGIKPEQLVRVTDIQAGAATVTGGRANAFAVGQFSIADPEQKGLHREVDSQSPISVLGVAFRKEDVRFRDAFNEQLNLLRGNGVMKELYAGKGIDWDTLARLTKVSDVMPSCE